jgi:hypothetical protein
MVRYFLLSVLATTLMFAAEVAGKWKIHSESSTGQTTDAVLEVREDWGAWNAVILVEDNRIPLKSVAVDGDKLTFQVEAEDVVYTVKAVVKEKQLEGTFTATNGTTGTIKGQRE